MCRSSHSHCNTRSAEGLGVIALVVIALAVIGTVGPAVMVIAHAVAEVIKLAAIGIATGAMLAVVTWVAVHILRARAISRPAPRIYLTARQEATRLKPVSEQACLTCGDTGRIVGAIGDSKSLQLRLCPECQPEQLTR